MAMTDLGSVASGVGAVASGVLDDIGAMTSTHPGHNSQAPTTHLNQSQFAGAMGQHAGGAAAGMANALLF